MKTKRTARPVPKLQTIKYEMTPANLSKIITDLDRMFAGKPVEKIEKGKPTDYEGHSFTYKIDGQTIFHAVVLPSCRKRYLVQSAEGLIEARK